MCVVWPVQRTEVPLPEITPELPQITIIDLEISEALEQRRQAYREENHPLREINQENEISDAETIVSDLESKTEQMSE